MTRRLRWEWIVMFWWLTVFTAGVFLWFLTAKATHPTHVFTSFISLLMIPVTAYVLFRITVVMTRRLGEEQKIEVA